jgi:hypothetical protein
MQMLSDAPIALGITHRKRLDVKEAEALGLPIFSIQIVRWHIRYMLGHLQSP